MEIRSPYLLFVGDTSDIAHAKTATGIKHWRPQLCAGQLRFSDAYVDLGLPEFSVEEAAKAGLKTIVIGVALAGGQLPDSWLVHLMKALECGLDIANGLHTKLNDIPQLAKKAKDCGRTIFDVRYPHETFPVGTGKKRNGQRLLTVGTDCAVGKMYTALAIEQELTRRGTKADFRATGQTGIFITGTGVCVDAVVSDFVSGATESLSPANSDNHWDIVEGQGSLFHPSYAGVSLGLLHGSQPDAIVLCHDVSRQHIIDLESYLLPSFERCIALNLELGRLTNPDIRCVGVSINTSTLDEVSAQTHLAETEARLGLPCADPVRTGVGRIVDQLN